MRTVVVVNERARRGGVGARRKIAAALPKAEVVMTSTAQDLERFASGVVDDEPDLVLVAGGDGSAIALMNQVRAQLAKRAPDGARRSRRDVMLRMGVLPLGTGNAWAHYLGAGSIDKCLERLQKAQSMHLASSAMPMRRFDLLEVEGQLSHFAGTGWDAEMIDDYHTQKTEEGLLPERVRAGLPGYLNGLLNKTVPRNRRLPRVDIEIENLGKNPLGVDTDGKPFELGPTKVLYRGPVGVCGVGTTQEWGFGFRAFPFAGLVGGRFNLRMYVGTALQALRIAPWLWAGKHPCNRMLTWLLDDCEVRLSRSMPFQIGGDLLGHRDRVRYAMAPEKVEVLDWRELGALVNPIPAMALGLLVGAESMVDALRVRAADR